MAYNHDPRYGPSPYPFQPQFHPPQPAMHQHNYNNNYGIPHPVGPAPPQSYLPPRNPMFPPHMSQQPPGGMQSRMQPDYSGPYDPAFQHNSQFGASFQGPNPSAQAIHNQPNSFQAMPFQPPNPNAQGVAPVNGRPLLIPPPPPGVGQSAQVTGPPGAASWQQSAGLPPKPPSMVQLQTGLNQSPGQHNYQNMGDQSQKMTVQGGNSAMSPSEYTPTNQNVGNISFTHSSQLAQQNQMPDYSPNAYSEARQVIPFAQEPGSPARPQNGGNHTKPAIVDLSQGQVSREKTPQVPASPLSDMYSPQSHTGGLPGLGSTEYNVEGGIEIGQSDASLQPQETLRHTAKELGQASSPVTKDLRGVEPSNIKTSNTSNFARPFAIKQDALTALRELGQLDIGFTEILAEGIDPVVLRDLYKDLDSDLDPRRSSFERDHTHDIPPKQATNDVNQRPPPQSAKSPEKKPAAPPQPTKPIPREDYIARLKAAKGDKSAGEGKSSNGAQDTMVVLDASDSGNESSQTPAHSKESEQPKKTEAKAMTDKVRERLEALKKTMGERQKQTKVAAQVKSMEEMKASGEYTPANPFFSPEAVSAGIPGLSMSDDGDAHRINDATFQAVSRGSTLAHHDDIPEENLDETDSRINIDEAGFSGPRKRHRASSSYDDSGLEPSKRRASPEDSSQVVIELSDDEEEGEVPEQANVSPSQRHLSGGSTFQESTLGKQTSNSQFHSDDLAAREEEIRLFREKIAALEAKKKAKKAVVSSDASPTPRATPVQVQRTNVPSLETVVTQKSALASVGDQVQAQQQSLVAAKSAVEERLEKEEQAFEAAVGAQDSTDIPTTSQAGDRHRRQERIQTLKQSLEALNQHISQAEVELRRLRKQEEKLQEELERGMKGRESFTKELNELIDAMSADNGATETSFPLGPGPEEDVDDSSPSHSAEKEPSLVNDSSQEEEEDNESDASSSSENAGDENMEMSEADDGEISESEDESIAQGEQQDASDARSSPETYEDFPEPQRQDDVMQNAPAMGDEEPHKESEKEGYEPQDYKESSEDEEMDYEPDYEPEPEPEQVHSDASTGEDYERLAESEGIQSRRESPDSQLSEDGEVADEESDPISEAVSEQPSDDDDPSDHDEESSMNKGATEGLQGVTVPSDKPSTVIADENGVSEELPGLGNGEEDDAEDDELEDNVEDNSAQVFVGFTPYESPLHMFKAYRFHPEYVKNISGGFNSITFSHCIDSQRQLCRLELQGGTCNDGTCPYQHFEEVKLSGDKLILQLGSVHEGRTSEETAEYVSGLRALLKSLRERGMANNVEVVAQELVEYRAQFLGDPSRVLTSICKET